MNNHKQLEENPVILLEGTYKDANCKSQTIHQKLQYPRMKEVNEKNDASNVDDSE